MSFFWQTQKNEELSIELLNLVNAKAALMRQMDNMALATGRSSPQSPSAEVDRVRAIVSRLSSTKIDVGISKYCTCITSRVCRVVM